MYVSPHPLHWNDSHNRFFNSGSPRYCQCIPQRQADSKCYVFLAPTEATDSQTTLQLQNSLAAARLRINSLEETYQHQLRIQKEFEEAFESTTAQIRTYCFEQQQHIKSLHEHYTELLQQSRYETIDAQIKHQQWQAGLKRISEGVREAYKSREKEGEPWKARIAALKEENRILRAKVGWDPPIDSDEEDEEEEEGSAGDEARGRASQGSGGAVAAGIGSPGLSEQLAPMIS